MISQETTSQPQVNSIHPVFEGIEYNPSEAIQEWYRTIREVAQRLREKEVGAR